MVIAGDLSGSNNDTDDDSEESSDKHEQNSNTNNQPPSPNELSPSVQEATHDDQESNDVQDNTNGQNSGLAAWPPDRHEAQTSQVSRNFWYWYWFILMQLGSIIGLCWQWLVLDAIGIPISGSSIVTSSNQRGTKCRKAQPFHSGNSGSHRNGYAANGIARASDIFIIIFMLFATMIILTHTPLDVENIQPHDLVMSDNVNNTNQNLPMNNDLNENATLYNNFDDDSTNTFAHDEPGVQAIVMESIASEVVDNLTCNINPLVSTETQDYTDSNHDSDEESEHIFSSESDFDADDETGTDFDSDNGYNTKSENDSINDNAESLISEISFDMNGEDYQIDDNDGMSIISHITGHTDSEDDSIHDNDDISVSTDDGYDTKSENGWINDNSESSLSSEISYGVNGEDSSIDENNERSLFSDSGYEISGEDNSITDDDERSLISDINYETNNENDQIDDNDKMSIISHITYGTSSEDDSISDNGDISVSTDDGYDTKSENISFIDNNEEDVFIEVQNNISLDQKITTVEQSIPPTLSTDSSSDQLLTIEEDADALIDVEHREIVLSTNPTGIDSIKQPSSINLNDESNEERPSLQVVDNTTCNINPLVSIETEHDTDSNHDSGEENEKIVDSELILHDDDKNDHLVVNNNQQGQMVSSIETDLNDVQNNAQLDQISRSNEQSATQILPSDSSSDQTLQIEQKTVDQTEVAGQEVESSTRPTSMHFQKQPSPVVNPNERLFKQNAE